MTDSVAPERIWATFEPHESGKGHPHTYATAMPTKGHEYVRADLYKQAVRELAEALRDYRATWKRAEAAERLAGARVKAKEIVKKAIENCRSLQPQAGRPAWEAAIEAAILSALAEPAGARVVTLPDDDDKLAEMVEDFHRGSVAFANDPDEFQHLIEFTPDRLRSFIAALAEPAGEVEPVAWRYKSPAKGSKWTVQKNYPESVSKWGGYVIQPLYPTPPDASEIRGADKMANTALMQIIARARDARPAGYAEALEKIDRIATAALAGAKP